MFDQILVPLDGSTLAECVLPHVISIARASSSRITLLHVVDHLGSTPGPMRALDPVDCAIRKAEAEQYLNSISDRLSPTRLIIETALMEGQAAYSIIRYAQDHQFDLIALSSHGRSGLSGWNINSVAQKVILRAYTSLLVVPAYQTITLDRQDFRYQKVLVPLDGSLRAEWVLPFALKLVGSYQALLILAHVIPKPDMPSYLPLLTDEVDLSNLILERNKRNAEKYLKELCSQLPSGIMNIIPHLVVGKNPIETLQELAENENIDLVILSAHGSTGGLRRSFGSVALSFITYCAKPLLIMQDLNKDRIILQPVEMKTMERSGH